MGACSVACRKENSVWAPNFLARARQHPFSRAWWQPAFSVRQAPPGHHQGTDIATCVVRLSSTLLRKAADRRTEGWALERRLVKISNIFFCFRGEKKTKRQSGVTLAGSERDAADFITECCHVRNYFQMFFFLFSLPFLCLIGMWNDLAVMEANYGSELCHNKVRWQHSGGVSSVSVVTFDSYRVSTNSINCNFFFY